MICLCYHFRRSNAIMDNSGCVIHFQTQKDEVLDVLTEAKVNKLLEILPKWSECDKGPENDIATHALTRNISCESNYHKSCYLKIGSDSKLTRALSSHRKRKVR